MYGDFLKTQEPDDPHHADEPQPLVPINPPTAKKRHILGRSSGRVEPLRFDPMSELSEVFRDLAKKERRSHGCMTSRNESREWASSSNTIPETLNSSREWNMPYGIDRKHGMSQQDVRDTSDIKISESTPLKNSHASHGSVNPPISMDKENFYTPHKAKEAPSMSTPAQMRCPLSALPVDCASSKDMIDGVRALPSELVSTDLHQGKADNGGEKNLLGSAVKISSSNHDHEGFRTPQCKPSLAQQNSLTNNGSFRTQRLYGVSSSKYRNSNIPLHPAILASQQAKRQQQLDSQNQPQESSALRRLGDTTPFKSAPSSSVRETPTNTVFSNNNCQPSNFEKSVPSSSIRPLYSRPVETTPFKAVPALSKSSIPEVVVTQPVEPQLSTIDSSCSLSTFLPRSKFGNAADVRPLHNAGSQQPHATAGSNAASSSQKKSSPTPARFELAEPAGQFSNLRHQDANHAPSVPSLPMASEAAKDSKYPPPSVAAEPAKVQSPPPSAGVKLDSPLESAKPAQAHVVQSETKKPTEVEQRVNSSGSGQILVNGHVYTILSLLGRGGSSKVFQVLDTANSQLKAVKCVTLAETDQSICDGYLNEIKLLADLQDGDCVIRMFDHEHRKDKDMLFVVMEKGDTDLSKLIKDVTKSKKISAAMIVYYWTEMLNAVSFIHKRGTIHSDLKPANFLLVSGRLKLIDFGIASSVQEDMTSVVKDSLTGTYNYISPEALSTTSQDGQTFKISYKSDVWSLGCILYNLVYGRTPFQHITNQFQKLNAIVSSTHRIQFPDPPIAGCPSALIQAMKLCLVRNPKERASVDELLQLPYLEYAGPERGILSQVANLAASVGIIQETKDDRCAAVVRAIQRLIMENERQLPFLGGRK